MEEYRYNISYPKGGKNKMWEPMNLKVFIGIDTGITVRVLTWTRNGCKIILLDENQEKISSYEYNYHDLYYHSKMTEDVARDINIMFELTGVNFFLNPLGLSKIMMEVWKKCASRYGNRLPDSDYEALVSFT